MCVGGGACGGSVSGSSSQPLGAAPVAGHGRRRRHAVAEHQGDIIAANTGSIRAAGPDLSDIDLDLNCSLPCLMSQASCQLSCEIVAHSRWLTAMDIHPTKDIVATVAEDGTIAVWSLPLRPGSSSSDKAACLLNWMHAMPTGVAFCGPSDSDVAVVALDNEELRVYRTS